jgi:hypothetical protein
MDYRNLGLTDEHIPDLIRLALDEAIITSDDDVVNCAPIHAWRALGKLRAEAAIEPLLQHFKNADDDEKWWDYATEELPFVYAMIGPSAIPVLSTQLTDETQGEYARSYASYALEQIAHKHPAARDEIVAILQSVLERFDINPIHVNTSVLDRLIELKAVEAAPLMERAFAAGKIDEMMRGDWDDVQVDLGLKEKPSFEPSDPTVARIMRHLDFDYDDDFLPEERSTSTAQNKQVRSAQKKAKDKRKQAKKSRKQNRKR